MEPMSMNDGLDGRETVAFGLGSGELATVVVALMAAYASLRSPLPDALGWGLAGLLGGAGAVLAWGRLAGRPLLEWTLLLARFVLRTRQVGLRHRTRRIKPPSRRPGGNRVIPLALRPYDAAMGNAAGDARVAGAPFRPGTSVGGAVVGRPAAPGRSYVVGFFSLNGGSGRTTLAVEVATLLAVRGRAAAAAGGRGMRVGLADLTERNPAAAMRLGIPLEAAPSGAAGNSPAVHETGLLVIPGKAGGQGQPRAAAQSAIAVAELAGAEVVILDMDCDVAGRCTDALERCDEVHIVVTPTAGGVLDAYRSTAALRRLGLRDCIGYVVNRCHGDHDLAETMADLGGRIAAEVPEDDAFTRAESEHRPAVLAAPAVAAGALDGLARAIAGATADHGPAPPGWVHRDAV